jgi:hypothetical protein
VRARQAHVWDRADGEWYVEPTDCTTALLTVERFRGQVWDPACGGGNVVRALDAADRAAFGTDIVDRGWGQSALWHGVRDFLTADPARFPAQNIITNPPFGKGKLAEAFIRHALMSPHLAKLAVFVDARFLYSTKRAQGLYAEHPPSRVWIIAPRPSCPPGAYLAAGNKAQGGTADFVWIIWDRTHPHVGTSINWLLRTCG